ncbi:MAG TPA: hypothetical protein VN361_00040 [Oxalicibacterium sp.]|nr:hypothetical protein [Oxalicibacterium sp.]
MQAQIAEQLAIVCGPTCILLFSSLERLAAISTRLLDNMMRQTALSPSDTHHNDASGGFLYDLLAKSIEADQTTAFTVFMAESFRILWNVVRDPELLRGGLA